MSSSKSASTSDQETPTCGRCLKLGLKCTKSFKYRFHRESFASDQKWLRTPTDLTFVDETQDSMKSESPFLPDHTTNSVHSPSIANTVSPDLTASEWDTFRARSPRIQRDISPQRALSDPSPIHVSIDSDNAKTTRPRSPMRREETEIKTLAPVYVENAWPLKDPSEALLLRHFIHNLAIWLDLCDPLQHFQVDVPRRAGTCRILLNAIFALSARHLSRTGDYDSYASNMYHQECLKHLIPMLNDTATVTDESLFAATIILRVLEEMDAPEGDPEGHMLGIQVFVGARDPYSMGGGMSEAAFWVGLRQEIYSAVIKHKSVQLNLEHCLVDRSIEPTSDFGWANRAVIHCADVLNCCFGDLGVSIPHWTDLKERCDSWKKLRPPSFTPIFYREADRGKREAFPEIWHSHACHIIGIQHHMLAQILLAIFNPKIPRLGGSRTTALRSMEDEIKDCLRDLCGIGLYNRWTPPGMFTASMGISLCGDRFTDRIDQEALLDILARTEKDHARPTAALQQQMMTSWGWE
ncbi:hypothetical protein BP6252_06975 [Coleophoma cylindrospora]|uniref:Zn(2)-C6 fungal-type domain-containing protein n=1 Tax=Coleophoma cylindrospora TaxID=1849047 RepID=A0A3D8RGL4_9HELO|nr:hypothetical protein BP6252_06975 [Coleophoma cylindrospora]